MLDYCDYIANTISKSIVSDSTNDSTYILDSTNPKMDLNGEGHYLSSKRTIKVLDTYGQTYKVTIEVDND